MNASVATQVTPSGQRIIDYMVNYQSYGGVGNGDTHGDNTAYRNGFWTQDRKFTDWLTRSFTGDTLGGIPNMARAILEEAYELNALEHLYPNGGRLADGSYVRHPATGEVTDDPDVLIRAIFPGAIPDDNLARLRGLVTELNTLRKAANEPISVHDPRLRPIWIEAARAATEARFCSEYDRMAAIVGIPTRDELAEELQHEYLVRAHVRVSYNVTHQRSEWADVTYHVVATSEDNAWTVAREQYDNESESDTLDRVDADDLPVGDGKLADDSLEQVHYESIQFDSVDLDD